MYFIWLLFLIIANKELPRIVMLSSDPDQHVFFLNQFLRFHTLPYTQFYWGDQPFHYPGGFAVLNFIWTTISGLDVRNVVSVQRLIQSQLAILIIVECVRSAGNDALQKGRVYFTFLCLIFCVYYLVLPEGFDSAFFCQAHTALLGTLLFVSMGFSFFFFAWVNNGDTRYRENLNIPLNVAAIILIVSALMLIHPITGLYAIVLYSLGIIVFWRGSKRKGDWAKAAAVLPLGAFPLLDPYYSDILVGFLRPGAPVAGDTGMPGFLKTYVSVLADSFRGISHIPSLFQTGLLDDTLNMFLVILMILSVVFLFYRKYLKWRVLSLIVITGLFLIIASVLLTGLLNAATSSVSLSTPVMPAGSHGVPWHFIVYQLPLYLTLHMSKYVIVWLFLGIGVVLAALVEHIDYTKIVLGTLIIILCFVIVSGGESEKSNIVLPRKYMLGGSEEITGNDLAVIKKVEGLFREYRETGGSLDYRTVPRILILNEVITINDEIWLLPRGASRILPLYDVFPVSFFYYQGMSLFSYENYMRHVHDTFDVEWLLDNNIRYLFIPSDKGGAVIEGLDSIIEKREGDFRGKRLYVYRDNPIDISALSIFHLANPLMTNSLIG